MTPQRSTQYATMVETLAEPELLASPLGDLVRDVMPCKFGGRNYLLTTLELPDATGLQPLAVLPRLGASSEAYEYYERLGDVEGPLLRPLEQEWVPFVPLEMAEARRYKGKTNEIFTRVLLNVAIFAGAYRAEYASRLRILDPLAGGGTTLFLALAAGYDAFGIEQARQDCETTAVFIKQYLNSERRPYKELDERRRSAGRRYQFEVGSKGATRWITLIHGDTKLADQQLRDLPGGPGMHAIVGDLPYGVQHFSELADLLQGALPAWERVLLPGGTLALAWNATRITRAEMVALIEGRTGLHVRQDPPYTRFEHTVDRVIKRRDILVAVKDS